MSKVKKATKKRSSAGSSSSTLKRIRFLPVLVLVAFLSLGVRMNDFLHDVRQFRLTPPVQAGEKPAEAEPAPAHEDHEEKAEVETEESKEEAEPAPRLLPSALDADIEFSQERVQIFSELAARREELNQRERQINQREALLKAAEVQFNMKLNELESLRQEIETLLQQQSDEEEARIASLVKIYEGMKAKDAARIFNTLEMPVLLAVVGRMSERKSAPVLAAMDAERARHLTILLVEQKQLPQLPDEN